MESMEQRAAGPDSRGRYGKPPSQRYTTTNSPKLWYCSTAGTSCTLPLDGFTVNSNFCVSITAHGRHGSTTTTAPRCQPGVYEIKLHPVTLINISEVVGRPRCLSLHWMKSERTFLIATSEIHQGALESQVQFRAQRQVCVKIGCDGGDTFVTCLFRPDTEYSVRLRHRYRSNGSLWSQWSNEQQGRTAEGAPSSGPSFWRRVIAQEGSRLTSLLWKPLPHSVANGRVLFYNVTCSSGNTHVLLAGRGNCSRLEVPHTSCLIKLPPEPWSCSISASTSIGPSPKAQIWFNKANAKEPPPLSSLSVSAVDDRRVRVSWAPPAAALPHGVFVVEWFVVTQTISDTAPLYWERVNGSTTAVITEGVEPFKRYAVSVWALYENEEPGQSKPVYVYTRQGAPSAGPKLQVQTTGSRVNLSWTVPVEKLRGFIQNYTLYYKTANPPAKSEATVEVLSGDAKNYFLSLSPGHWEFYMRASTEAGEGVQGPLISLYIDSEDKFPVLYVILPIGLISLLLMLMVCLPRMKTIRETFFKDIPDPSHSTLADWTPKKQMGMTLATPEKKYSEVVLLSGREMDSDESDEDPSMHYSEDLSDPDMSFNPFQCKQYNLSHRTTNMAETSFNLCPAYSIVLASALQPHSSLSLGDLEVEQPLEGASELSTSSTKSILLQPQAGGKARPGPPHTHVQEAGLLHTVRNRVPCRSPGSVHQVQSWAEVQSRKNKQI
uniref:Fibronectin type-III domain-containing protein n=1 Tax=Knipowitschia caucasica TaxID=637954 RepID=A0AAV2JJ65_KNICA